MLTLVEVDQFRCCSLIRDRYRIHLNVGSNFFSPFIECMPIHCFDQHDFHTIRMHREYLLSKWWQKPEKDRADDGARVVAWSYWNNQDKKMSSNHFSLMATTKRDWTKLNGFDRCAWQTVSGFGGHNVALFLNDEHGHLDASYAHIDTTHRTEY